MCEHTSGPNLNARDMKSCTAAALSHCGGLPTVPMYKGVKHKQKYIL